jgi:hypothetical protein
MMGMNNYYNDRIAQLQQYQQSLNTFSALGKIVENEDVVKTTDIPMDGNMYYFPRADGSVIYGKQWLANGTTRLLTFKPTFEVEPNNSTTNTTERENGANNNATDVLLEQLKGVNERLERIENNIRQSSTNKGKKGVIEDAES